ncbi:MAG: HAMP domain-containing histidine kinase [Spirochaetaceae bacterium]|nr:HAMP domain-containing histidine kinase [Spirochaetaceae bacterium]
MKIRTQFTIFVIGIIGIPFCVFMTLFLIRYYNRPERVLIPGYNEISEIAEADIAPKDWHLIERALNHMPADVEVSVLTADNVIVYSTINVLEQNMHYSDEEIMQLIHSTSRQFYYQMDTPTLFKVSKNGNIEKEAEQHSELFVITRLPRRAIRKPSSFISFYWIVIEVFGILIIFCSVMLSLISRSITRSITMLEKATKQITLGNLDEPVERIKGSNEITSLTESLNKMRLALKEDNLRRTRLIMGISHDLRTPIALIKGYTEALSDGVVTDPEEKQRSIEIVGNKIEQLEDMIDELINFVKVDSGEWRQNLELHKVSPFLKDFARRLESDGNLLERNVRTAVNIDDSVLAAYDEKLLIRALENLAGNALRYSEKGGEIFFNAEATDVKILVKISNTGSLIAEKDLPFIFDPFFRGSNSRREKGTGLGLSIVKSIIESHGWSISVDTQNKLTTFTIDIPYNS